MSDFVDAAQSLIRAERKRQIAVEGWDAEHDDRHDEGEMLHAAVIYMHWGTDQAPALREDGAPLGWPWDVRWWKPKTRVRNLERAGALMLAEKERLGRVRWQEDIGDKRKPGCGTIHIYRDRTGMPTAHVDQKLDLCTRALDAALESSQ